MMQGTLQGRTPQPESTTTTQEVPQHSPSTEARTSKTVTHTGAIRIEGLKRIVLIVFRQLPRTAEAALLKPTLHRWAGC